MWWECAKVKRFWNRIFKEIEIIIEQKIQKKPELALMNIFTKENKEIKEKTLIGYLLTAARLMIASSWKTARMLTLEIWKNKILEIAINEKLTQKLQLQRGTKQKDNFKKDWGKYIEYMKKSTNRNVLSEPYKMLWDI